jgi:hypothetical protein
MIAGDRPGFDNPNQKKHLSRNTKWPVPNQSCRAHDDDSWVLKPYCTHKNKRILQLISVRPITCTTTFSHKPILAMNLKEYRHWKNSGVLANLTFHISNKIPMYFKLKLKLFYNRRSVGQSVLASSHRLGNRNQFFLYTEIIFRHLRFF